MIKHRKEHISGLIIMILLVMMQIACSKQEVIDKTVEKESEKVSEKVEEAVVENSKAVENEDYEIVNKSIWYKNHYSGENIDGLNLSCIIEIKNNSESNLLLNRCKVKITEIDGLKDDIELDKAIPIIKPDETGFFIIHKTYNDLKDVKIDEGAKAEVNITDLEILETKDNLYTFELSEVVMEKYVFGKTAVHYQVQFKNIDREGKSLYMSNVFYGENDKVLDVRVERYVDIRGEFKEEKLVKDKMTFDNTEKDSAQGYNFEDFKRVETKAYLWDAE